MSYTWSREGNCLFYNAPQGTKEWLEVRKGRPSGSIIGSILGHSKFDSPEDTLDYLSMRREKKFSPEAMARMSHGNKFEDVARQEYEFISGNTVSELGFVIPSWEPRIGVSVDGIVDDDGIIEIKCPQRMYRQLTYEPVKASTIWPTHYDQMQMGMYVLGRKWCDYVVMSTSEEKIYIQRIFYDRGYWESCMKVIKNFLDNKLTPSLQGTGYPLMPPSHLLI